MNSLPPVPVMLRRCGPLLDAVRFAVDFLKWTTPLSILGAILPRLMALQQQEEAMLIVTGSIMMIFVVLQLMGFRAYWLLMEEGGKRDLGIFLRAFRSDASSDQLRAWLKAAMGSSWRLGGIRPPAERESLRSTLVSPLFTGLKYLGSRQFEMVAPDHNWMAKLLASFSGTRMVFIDIRDITPHVLDEIHLAWQVFGPSRTIFIVDATKTEEVWNDLIHRQLGCECSSLLLLCWTADSATFVPAVQALLARIPEGSAVVTPEALAFVHGKVGAAQWGMRLLDRPWVLVLLQQLCLFAACGLLWFIHPMAMKIGAGLLAMKALHLYLKAWCRARRQRLDAMKLNPAGSPSARRLWTSLVLMLSALVLPFLIALSASCLFEGNIDVAKISRAKSDLSSLKLGLMSYESRALRLPTSEQGLRALVDKPTAEPVPENWRRWLDKEPLDPWLHPYRYEYPARHSKAIYDLWSPGPDGIDGTTDDITNFSQP